LTTTRARKPSRSVPATAHDDPARPQGVRVGGSQAFGTTFRPRPLASTSSPRRRDATAVTGALTGVCHARRIPRQHGRLRRLREARSSPTSRGG
jgi:hypothetical protein